MQNEKRSEKVTDEEMDEMIQRLTMTIVSVKRRTVEEIVEVAHSVHTEAYSAERIAGQIAARTCRKEQTVEAMKMIPQERVSKRIVKQIMDKPVPQVAGAERQGFPKPRNKSRTRRHNLQCLKTGSSSEPLNKLWSCEDACPANREHS